MPKPYPQGFRDDVARRGEAPLKQAAADFGIVVVVATVSDDDSGLAAGVPPATSDWQDRVHQRDELGDVVCDYHP